MAEITRQRQGEFMSAVVQILSEAPDGLPAKDVLAAYDCASDCLRIE